MAETCKGSLWFTSMGYIVLDDHNSEMFSEPFDKRLMTKEELSNGISVDKFKKRLKNLKPIEDLVWKSLEDVFDVTPLESEVDDFIGKLKKKGIKICRV